MCISERCRHVRHNGARGGAFGAARDHVGMEWRRPAPGEGRSAKYDSEISQQTDKQKCIMALAQMMQEQYGNQIPDWYGDAVCNETE